MKLNEKSITFSLIEKETIEGQTLAYIPDTQKILCFNRTATLIYDTLTLASDDCEITSQQLCNMLMDIYKLPPEMECEVLGDVEGVLCILFKEGLLHDV